MRAIKARVVAVQARIFSTLERLRVSMIRMRSFSGWYLGIVSCENAIHSRIGVHCDHIFSDYFFKNTSTSRGENPDSRRAGEDRNDILLLDTVLPHSMN